MGNGPRTVRELVLALVRLVERELEPKRRKCPKPLEQLPDLRGITGFTGYEVPKRGSTGEPEMLDA